MNDDYLVKVTIDRKLIFYFPVVAVQVAERYPIIGHSQLEQYITTTAIIAMSPALQTANEPGCDRTAPFRTVPCCAVAVP